MADISKVVLPNNSEYNVKDTVARSMPSAYYGTCATAAATAIKVVTISADQNFVLSAGVVIGVRYTYTNTASSVTLNVNGTGAKSIRYNTSAYTGSDSGVCGYANRTIFYMYDGTYWVHLSYGYNTNGNTVPTAYSTTAAGTAAKAATCTNYNLLAKSYTILLISTTNTAASALTLNINGKGAKPIYINGTASSASNHTMPAGSYLVYYDGTNYYIRTDGKITGDITGDAATVNGKTVGVNVPADAKFTDTVVTKTSELTNDSNFAVDANYVHTDNNYTSTEKTKLAGVATGAEANVQSDWNVTDTASDAYIKNKPTIPTIPSNIVTDANYVHTDNNYTTTEKNKLSGIATGAEVNVQSDWNVTDTSSDAYIKNKPTIPTDFPPKNHASTATAYGLGDVSNYGHVKLSDTYNALVGSAADGLGASQQALYDAYNLAITNSNSKAPKNHASTDATYGQGNASNFGHVKLSNTYTASVSGGNAAGGVGASQNALYNAYSTNKDRIDTLFNTSRSFDGSNVNIPHNTLTNVVNFTATAGEKSFVQVSIQWATNASGFREVVLATGESSGAMTRYHSSRIAAASGATTNQMLWCVINQGSSNQQIYVNVRQSSGSNLNVAYYGVKTYTLTGL